MITQSLSPIQSRQLVHAKHSSGLVAIPEGSLYDKPSTMKGNVSNACSRRKTRLARWLNELLLLESDGTVVGS